MHLLYYTLCFFYFMKIDPSEGSRDVCKFLDNCDVMTVELLLVSRLGLEGACRLSVAHYSSCP